MKTQIKQIAENTFWYLLIVYTILILIISLGFISKYSLYFNILALIIAILGISIIIKEPSSTFRAPTRRPKVNHSSMFGRFNLILLIIALILILIPRIIPYIINSVPIGYDSGIYKYSIDQFKSHGFGIADWIKASISPLFLYLMYPLSLIFSTNFILTGIFILSCLLLGFAIYLITKAYFSKETALISILIYAVSVIQFKVFALMYYKNILALSLMLFSLYFLKKEQRTGFIIFASLTGAMHLPTFYILGLSYFFYAFISPIKLNQAETKKYDLTLLKNNVLNGIIILIITLVLYLGFIHQAILPLISPVLNSYIQPGESPGTFITFFQYQFSTLAYLPFAILGFFALIKRKQLNPLFFLALITASIVYFQFFFFNRFIIHLDIFIIILAAAGFMLLIEHKKKLGIALLAIMLLSSFYTTLNDSTGTKPGITPDQFRLIQQLNQTEPNASVMSISSQYSPYVLAYSGRRTIAPGLFDENKWNLAQWNTFWASNSTQETHDLMQVYDKPTYLFAGTKRFNNACFTAYLEENSNKIYKYIC